MHKVDVYLRVRRAVLEWGFRAGVARRLRDKGMPAVEIVEVLEVTRASVDRDGSTPEAQFSVKLGSPQIPQSRSKARTPSSFSIPRSQICP